MNTIKVKGGTALAACLAAEKVTTIFTVSGGGLSAFYAACPDYGIRVIHTRHEYGAGFMADGWARATGEPGVCVTTLGPGLTNAITGMLSGIMGGVPIVFISSCTPVSAWDLGTAQGFEHLPLVKPVTKYAKTVYETRRIPEYVANAFRLALTGRPGPVFLEIPGDVLNGEVSDEQARPMTNYRTEARSMGDPSMIEKAADLLKKAPMPIVIAGSGVFWSKANTELQTFVNATGIPVFTGRIGRGTVPPDHPLYFGIASISVNNVFLKALKEADVALMVGGHFDYMLGFGRPPIFNPSTKAIQIDIVADEIGRNRPVEVGIVADARMALGQLTEAMGKGKPRADWISVLRDEKKRVESERTSRENSNDLPIYPLRLLKEIRSFLNRDAIIACGSGDIDFWGEHYFEPNLPGGYLRSGQVGALGSEIPYAVAAKLANPERQVLVLVGDGGFGYSAMELETAARHNAPVVCVIANDKAWAMIKEQQKAAFGAKGVVGTEMPDRSYEKLAAVFGGYGERVTRPDQLRGALERAFGAGVPAILNVDTRTDPSPELQWMLRPKK